jgi:hypothetical protein
LVICTGGLQARDAKKDGKKAPEDAKAIAGTTKAVDAAKKTVTVSAGGKTLIFAINKDTKIVGPGVG